MVLGASENTERYSNKAVRLLLTHHHEVIAIGNREGFIEDTPILKIIPQLSDIDTITLYINPSLQELFKDVIIAANPKRIIFNPGTENPELEALAQEKGIQTLEACTLVMLKTNQY